uniref:Uncharacterized protein n=1 Tax=Craspedostauros australis TaxID=1486917 RepID=A0A7R9WP57_9STRA
MDDDDASTRENSRLMQALMLSLPSFLSRKNIIIILLLYVIFAREARDTNRIDTPASNGTFADAADAHVDESSRISTRALDTNGVKAAAGDMPSPPPLQETAAPFFQQRQRDHLNRETGHIPLQELVMTSNFKAEMCPEGTTFINSTFINPTSATGEPNATLPPRKIPRIVHITARIPCMRPSLDKFMQRWHLEGHSFAFHDEVAVDRLLGKFCPEFPSLQSLQECLAKGARKADLWKYLVLYEYGGIHADVDVAPGESFLGDGAIQPQDDAYGVVAEEGCLAPYFIATSPRHPIMFFSLHVALAQLYEVRSVIHQNGRSITGQKAMQLGAMSFVQRGDLSPLTAGLHVGVNNRTMRVVGNQSTTESFIERNSPGQADRARDSAELGVASFHAPTRHVPKNEPNWLLRSCRVMLHEIAKNQRSPLH